MRIEVSISFVGGRCLNQPSIPNGKQFFPRQVLQIQILFAEKLITSFADDTGYAVGFLGRNFLLLLEQ